jgi:hypothetical protein
MNDKEESWIKQYWRPAMAWSYATICIFDFIIFPLLTMSITPFLGSYSAWDPITLKESGFYHMAMMAVLGVAAWTRGQEKISLITKEDETKN